MRIWLVINHMIDDNAIFAFEKRESADAYVRNYIEANIDSPEFTDSEKEEILACLQDDVWEAANLWQEATEYSENFQLYDLEVK